MERHLNVIILGIIGAMVNTFLALWINNVTEILIQNMQAVATTTAQVEAHLDGHPGRVQDEVRAVHKSVVELQGAVKSLSSDVQELKGRGGPKESWK